MSKKLAVVILCLVIVLVSILLGKENRTLSDAGELLISKMLESEKAVEVFNMHSFEQRGIYT